MHRSICGNHGFSEGEWAMMVNYAMQIAIERMSSLTWKLYNALSVVCFVLCCETYVNCFQCHWTGISQSFRSSEQCRSLKSIECVKVVFQINLIC